MSDWVSVFCLCCFAGSLICLKKVAVLSLVRRVVLEAKLLTQLWKRLFIENHARALFLFASGTQSFNLFSPGSPPKPNENIKAISAPWSKKKVSLWFRLFTPLDRRHQSGEKVRSSVTSCWCHRTYIKYVILTVTWKMMCIRLTIDHLLNPTTEYWLSNYMLTSLTRHSRPVSSGLRHVSRMHMATEWMIFRFFSFLIAFPKPQNTPVATLSCSLLSNKIRQFFIM